MSWKMRLKEAKKIAIVNWFNSVTSNTFSEDCSLTKLTDAAEISRISSSMWLHSISPTSTSEEVFNFLKASLNDDFNFQIELMIDFSSCVNKEELEIAKVLIFLLSAYVQHLLHHGDITVEELTLLENEIQKDIEECMSFVLNCHSRDKNDLNTLLGQDDFTTPRNGTSKTPRMSKRRSSSRSTSRSKKVLKTPTSTSSIIATPVTPIKTFLDSPLMQQQVANRNKEREIRKLREQLHSEENKVVDLSNENECLKKDLEKEANENKHLREKLESFYGKEDINTEYKNYAELYEKNVQESESLRKKIEEYEESNTLLRKENEELYRTNEILEGKFSRYSAVKTKLEECQSQVQSLVQQLQDKTHCLAMEMDKYRQLESTVKELSEEKSAYKQMHKNACDEMKKFQNSSELVEKDVLHTSIADAEMKELRQKLEEKDAIISSSKVKPECCEQDTQTECGSNFYVHDKEDANSSLNNLSNLRVKNELETNLPSITKRSYPFVKRCVSQSLDGEVVRNNIIEQRTGVLSKPCELKEGSSGMVDSEMVSSDSEMVNSDSDSEIVDSDSEMVDPDSSLLDLISNLEEKFKNIQNIEEYVTAKPLNKLVCKISKCTKICFKFYENLRDVYKMFSNFPSGITRGEMIGVMANSLNQLEDEAKVVFIRIAGLLNVISLYKSPSKLTTKPSKKKTETPIKQIKPVGEIENKQILELNSLVKELIEKDSSNQQKINDLNSSLTDLKAKCDELEQKYSDELSKKKEIMQHQIIAESKMKNLQLEIQSLQYENEKLKKSCEQKQKAMKEFVKEITLINENCEKSKKKSEMHIQVLNQDIAKYRIKLVAIKKSMENLEQKVVEKDELLNNYSGQLKLCQNKYENKKSEERQLRAILEMEQNKAKTLNLNVNKQRNYLSSMQTKIEKLEEMVKSSEQEKKTLTAELQRVRDHLSQDRERSERDSFNQAVHDRLASTLDPRDYNTFFHNKKPTCSTGDTVKFRGNQLSISTTIQLEGLNTDDNVRNTSFDSIRSGGLNSNKSILSNNAACFIGDDEEVFHNHSSIAELRGDMLPPPESASKRINELRRRNTLCPPHMRSTYPVELQAMSPSRYESSPLMKSFESQPQEKDKTLSRREKLKRMISKTRDRIPTPKKLQKNVKKTDLNGTSSSTLSTPASRRQKAKFQTPASLRKLINLNRKGIALENAKKYRAELEAVDHFPF